MEQEKIIIVDFGGQYTQLIAKRIREASVYSEIVSRDISVDEIKKINPKGIIFSGGPDSVYEDDAPTIDKGIFSLEIPILGICYGMQLTNYLLGGKIISGSVKEYGETEIKVLVEDSKLFRNIPKKSMMWMSHGDSVDADNLPEGFVLTAKTSNHTAAVENADKKIYTVQFHPEVTHSEYGKELIENFVTDICECSGNWTMSNYLEKAKDYIRETVGKNDVICFVSGGVDSSFVSVLLSQTDGIGKVYPIYIEGLMRKNETKEVEESLKNAGVEDLIIYYGEDEFIESVKGMSEPEEKRKAIGNLFGKIQDKMMKELNLNPETTFLAQGTLYTDLIESGKGVGEIAATIKSHHNVGCEFIENLKAKGKLVEPNKEIFKDEVRRASSDIGLPKEIYNRQPFPGPGLGIRIVDGNSNWVDSEFEQSNKQAKKIAEEFGLNAFLIPIKTVGVQGDGRTYSFVCVLQGDNDWTAIRKAANTIPMEILNVNRMVYEINPHDATESTEVIPTTITKESLRQLQDIDYTGRKIIDEYGFTDNISQTIFVLFGSDMHNTGKRSVCLRGVKTDDFMTVTPINPENGGEMSWKCLNEIASKLKKEHDVGAFVIDVTDKPPATTCWE